MHVGGGLKSALKEKGAVFWEMTAWRFGMTVRRSSNQKTAANSKKIGSFSADPN